MTLPRMVDRVHLPVVPTDDLGVRGDVRGDSVMGLADPWLDREPRPDRAVSCIMTNSLYVKANGEMPCWCDSGEDHLLERLTVERLMPSARNLPTRHIELGLVGEP